MSGCVGHEVLEVPDTPESLTMPIAGCLRWAVGAKRSGSVRFQERRENGTLTIEQEETKCGDSYLVSSVPDTPDRLASQNAVSLSRAVGGKRPRSVFEKRRENGISSSREQERTKRGMATSISSSDSPCFLGMTSCGRQLRLSKKDAFAQDQDHVHPVSPRMETCNKSSAGDKSLPKNDELCHSTREEDKRNVKESISGHAILTPKWNRRKIMVRNGCRSRNDATTDANMSNRGVKRLQVAGNNSKESVMNDVSADTNSSGMTSCGRQLRLSKKDTFAQDQDHVHPVSPRMETCNKSSAEDKSLPKNDELCHSTREEDKRNVKESISGHAILTPKWNRRKMVVRNGFRSRNDATTDANMSNRGVKRLQVAGNNSKESVMNDVSADTNSSGMTSRGRQLRLSKKDAFAQDEDHVHPGSPLMETCNKMSAENQYLPKNDEVCHSTQEEGKRNMKESISGLAIVTPKWNRRKMLVRNGRISPNDANTDANMSNRGVKRLQLAGDNLKGSVVDDANSLINGKQVIQPSGSCLPCSDQLNDRRKGKEIVSGDMDERDQEHGFQLTPNRKRVRGSLSSSEEPIRLPRCLNNTTHRHHGPSSVIAEARRQEPRNGFLFNRPRDSEENIQLACVTLPHSRIHQNEGQSSRLDKTSSRSSPLSLGVDEENSSDTGTPEVMFLRSSRQLRKNAPSTSINCNAQASCSDPIDVDSLESPLQTIVNVDASNKVSDARMKQIELDEILARQLQEEFAGEIVEERLQEDDPILHSTVQRETREHTSASDSGSIFPGLRANFGIGARREPARSLRTHSARASPLSSLRSAHSRTTPVYGRVSGSGLMVRSRGRSVHDRTFRFPRNMNLEMRVDLLEAMELFSENNNLTHQLISGVQRDFNEDDYEMLLALDDTNDNRRGASQQHIERLPTSIIQTDVSDEQCSICLENPKEGDVIRHLLCMHKFHKGCIDPWLEIQACCPVCKHSI